MGQRRFMRGKGVARPTLWLGSIQCGRVAQVMCSAVAAGHDQRRQKALGGLAGPYVIGGWADEGFQAEYQE
jgi:hypothetical protein